MYPLKCVLSLRFVQVFTCQTAAVLLNTPRVFCLRLKSHIFHGTVGWCVVQTSCLYLNMIIGGNHHGSINYWSQRCRLHSVPETLKQCSDSQCFTGTCDVPLHTILNFKQALMNYKRRDAAPFGQFKRIICVLPCSHPFIIRHKPLIKREFYSNCLP